MGKVSGNRKELNPKTVVTLWTDFKTKLTVKELCNVLELPRSTFYRWLQRTVDLRDEIEEKIKDVCLRHKLLLCTHKLKKGKGIALVKNNKHLLRHFLYLVCFPI